MIAALLLLASVCAPGNSLESEAGYRTATVRLTGPLDSVSFSVGEEVLTRLTGSLAKGEERELLLPFPASAANRTPEVKVVGSGTATFGEWRASGDELPNRLSRRTRPPVSTGEARAPTPALLLLIASGILALSLRRRPLSALGVAVLIGGLAGGLSAREGAASGGGVRVLEGNSGSEAWLTVHTALGRLDCGASLPARIEISPPGRSATWAVRLAANGTPRYALEGRGLALTSLRANESGGGSLDRENNFLVGLSETWTRGSAGAWRAHGAWPVGGSLPPVLAEIEGSPPGWLASGLPQGVPILLGRVADPTRIDPGEPGELSGRATEAWLRLTGF